MFMKKIFGVLVVMACLITFANNSFAACSWGSGWNYYTLSNQNYFVTFEFQPGSVGTNKIEVVVPAPLTVLTQIAWWSNAYPSWHYFVNTWAGGVLDLYAGSSDVKFQITFSKDLMKDGDYQVRWRYCIAY
jgi:hypothetical protein